MMANVLPDAYLSERFHNPPRGEVAFMRPPPRAIAAAAETAAPALVVFPAYRPDAAFELKSIERAQAFSRLIRELSQLPHPLGDRFRNVGQPGRGLRPLHFGLRVAR